MLRTIFKHFVICCICLVWTNVISLETGHLSNTSGVLGMLLYTYFSIYLVKYLKKLQFLFPWVKYVLIFIIASLIGQNTGKPEFIAYYNFYTFLQLFLFNVLTFNPNDVNKGV